MPPDTDVSRELGSLDARLKAVERDIGQVKADVREVRDVIVRVGGSWRTLVAVAGIAAAVGGLASKLLGLITFMPR